MPLYHGTCSTTAIESLLQGGALLPMRPDGRSAIAGAISGRSYLTPAFGAAAEYAFRSTREDWPLDHAVALSRSEHWVFEFDSMPRDALPDEDEVAHAARAALEIDRTGISRYTCMNRAYSDAVKQDRKVLDILMERMISSRSAAIRRIVEDRSQGILKGARFVRLGRELIKELRPDDIALLLALRPSISTAEEIRPVAAYRLDRLQFDLDGLERRTLEATPALA